MSGMLSDGVPHISSVFQAFSEMELSTIRNGPTSVIKEVERFARGRNVSYMMGAEIGL